MKTQQTMKFEDIPKTFGRFPWYECSMNRQSPPCDWGGPHLPALLWSTLRELQNGGKSSSEENLACRIFEALGPNGFR